MRLTIAVLFIVVQAGLAAGEVGVTVWAGAGGTVRLGATIPVVVQLQNDDRERSGVVAAGFAQDALPRTWAAQPLSLAPKARKRVFLYLPLQSMAADRIVVRYESESGVPQAVHEEPLQIVPAVLPLMAAVGQLPRGLPEPEPGGKPRYRSVILQPELLPHRFEGLEMYDVVAIAPTPELPFESDQVAALEDWVLRGGTLVVDASRRTDGLQQQDLRDLLPFLPESSEQHAVPGFTTPLTLARGAVHNGESLWTEDGVPLVVRRNHGLGSVVCFAFDPNEPGFLAHPKREELWSDILQPLVKEVNPTEPWQYSMGGTVLDNVMGRVSETGGTPARLGLVVLLTALYALVVGPGDYFLVKRLRKPYLTWITFPAIALAFSAAAYGGARAWFGGETISRGFHHLTVFPEAGKAIAFDAAGLFAGESGDYDLGHAHQALWRPLQSPFDPEQSIRIDSESAQIQQRIPVWSHRVYATGETVGECPDIRLARDEADPKKLRVVNNSRYALRDCLACVGDLQGACPRVAPGQTVSVDLAPKKPVSSPNGFDQQGNQVMTQVKSDTFLLSPAQRLRRVSGEAMDDGREPFDADGPFGRELFAGDALRRGALVLRAKVADQVASPLVVNGKQRTEKAALDLAVVTYGSASE